jgi:hypothetical protein
MSGSERMAAHRRAGAVGTPPLLGTERPAPLGVGSIAGRPLPAGVRARMETAFGADFSEVTVREDGAAAAMDAAAFTRGEGITFHPGLYDPSSPEGLEVLGHELAHVLQQRADRVPGAGVTEDPALESEAHEAGRRAAHGQPVPATGQGGGPQRSGEVSGSHPAGTDVAQPAGPLDRFRSLFRRGGTPAAQPQPESPHQRIPPDLQVRETPYQPIPRYADENPYDTLPADFNERVSAEAENPYDTLPADFNERVSAEAENPYGVFRPVPRASDRPGGEESPYGVFRPSSVDPDDDPIYNTLPAEQLKELVEGPYQTIPPELRAQQDAARLARYGTRPPPPRPQLPAAPPLPPRPKLTTYPQAAPPLSPPVKHARFRLGALEQGRTGSGNPSLGAAPARGILRRPRGPRS